MSQNNPFIYWDGNQADAQIQATQWIETHLSPKDYIIIDQSMWTDLHTSGFLMAHYYWKVQDDPAIRDKIFLDDWHTADYIVTTIQMLTDTQHNDMQLIAAVLTHSQVIARFDTGGWPIEIRKVEK